MTPFAARELLKTAYPSPKWYAKVNMMTDSQVFAILVRLISKGKVRR